MCRCGCRARDFDVVWQPRQVSAVNISGHYAPARAHLFGEPAGDRSATGADLQTTPPGGDT